MASSVPSVVLLAFLVHASGASRVLTQSAGPPNPSFGGPQSTLDPSIVPPAGNTVKINWHAVGTQNYSSSSNSQYSSFGAVADMYLQNGSTIVGGHFFINNPAGGLSPVFTKLDAQGKLQGTLVAKPVANTSAPAYNDDGGYGSVPFLLLQAVSADGFFQGVTYVQRIDTLGGTVPGNPKLFTLPTSPTGVNNKLLAVPYQANYLFFVNSGASATAPAAPTTTTSVPITAAGGGSPPISG